MTAPPEFSGYRAPHFEHPYRAHPFEPPKHTTQRPPHVQRRPPHAEGHQRPTQQHKPCHACHHEGHVANDCPTWKDRCYRCHEVGHASNSCALPDKRRKRPTRIIANDNRELARALTNINRVLGEIKARLDPNWAWRTLRPFRERTAQYNAPRKHPEEPQIDFPYNTPEAPQPKPPEAPQLRSDVQGCESPSHMHIGDNNMTVPRPQPNDRYMYDANGQGYLIKTPTPSDEEEDTRIREEEFQQYDEGYNDNGYDDGYDSDLWRPDCGPTVLHDHCPTGTDPFSQAIAMAHKATKPKPPTEQQHQQQPKTRHAKHKRRKKT